MKVNIKTGLLFLSLALAMQSCYYDKEELLYPGSTAAVDCSTVSAKFSANVQPIISAKCATSGCHDALTISGGKTFQNYSQISRDTARIKVRALIEKSMPQAGPLQPSEINIIRCWIESGAPNN